MNAETRINLVKEAAKYAYDKYELFEAELGWQDWMNEYTTAKEGEEASESEISKINDELMEIFFEAHENEIIDAYNETNAASRELCKRFKCNKGVI